MSYGRKCCVKPLKTVVILAIPSRRTCIFLFFFSWKLYYISFWRSFYVDSEYICVFHIFIVLPMLWWKMLCWTTETSSDPCKCVQDSLPGLAFFKFSYLKALLHLILKVIYWSFWICLGFLYIPYCSWFIMKNVMLNYQKLKWCMQRLLRGRPFP